MNENHEKWNEAMAKKYDPDSFITKSGFFIRTIEGIRLSRSKNLLQATNQHDVLDLGCGAGNILVQLKGKKIVGLDLSDTLLAKARDRCQGRANIEIIKGDAEHLPFQDNSFDRIICSEVLEHVQDPLNVLKEIHRVCRADGRVILSFPNEELINAVKKIIIFLGIKKFIAGNYPMSDNMMDEWHRNEISGQELVQRSRGKFKFITQRHVLFPFFSFHKIMAFRTLK